MSAKQKNELPAETRWSISPDWYQTNQRSAALLVKDYLCSSCAGKLKDNKEPALKTLMATVQSCCSRTPDFINEKMPIMESVFRLLLSNGNRPMTLKEISSELAKVRFGDIYRTSPEALLRILNNDSFYGVREIPG